VLHAHTVEVWHPTNSWAIYHRSPEEMLQGRTNSWRRDLFPDGSPAVVELYIEHTCRVGGKLVIFKKLSTP
jgi:hypothetical protein